MDSEEISLKISRDHWAFLDEIEAPMWVDLTLEANSNYTDVDDGWFHTSHLFHQCSSLQLKAAFAYSGEGSASSDIIDLKRTSSPELPSSVSRSRGKHYASKKWGGKCPDFSLNKKHPVKALSGKSTTESTGFCGEMKPKLSFINSKANSRLKTSLVVERDLTRNTKENHHCATYTDGNSEGSLGSMVDKASESNASTITCENDQKLQKRNLEISSRAFGHSSGLVSAMRSSLRKSCATRQASRVDVRNNNSNNRRQLRNSNSASGKSSVGSSSNSGYDVQWPTFALTQQSEQTPNSRNEARMIRVMKDKVKASYASKASFVQGKGGTSNSRREGTSNASKPTQKEAANSKVQSKTLRAKALLPVRINERRSLTGPAKAKVKVAMGRPSRMVGAGSENSTGNQKCSNGDIASGVMVRGQKAAKQYLSQKDDRTGRLKGKISSPSRGKHSTNTTQRVYLR
ncbi:uncharacterized protein LOC8283256 [Ricinus communis]|uniref:uncharacterized protein LOC8283256 n=1 Tax=Ricinus communis TaxID=3988 RepID=UPI00201AA0B9|nr:uncharacterized protein LOC8283256 [Ricinus communis]